MNSFLLDESAPVSPYFQNRLITWDKGSLVLIFTDTITFFRRMANDFMLTLILCLLAGIPIMITND